VTHEHGTHGVEGHEGEGRPGPLDLGEEDELVRGRRPCHRTPWASRCPTSRLAHAAHEGAEHLAALALAVERSADLHSQEVGEVRPQLGPQGQLLGSLFEMHGVEILHL